MKSILQSIKPQYCKLIASGKKTIEVRKTRPKLEIPFKVYIYRTKDELLTKSHNNGAIYLSENKYKSALEKAGNLTLSGKVIGEYICDKITEYEYMNQGFNFWSYNVSTYELALMGLSYEDFSTYGQGSTLYGWHISDLIMYDEPKELSEFMVSCKDNDCGFKQLVHPPQSWCYVEENNRL